MASVTATGVEIRDGTIKRGVGAGIGAASALSHANHDASSPNGHPTKSTDLRPLAPIVTQRLLKKYRHVAAVHSKERTACLSHDSTVTPSFLGFRNLMVIVLGRQREPQKNIRRIFLTV
jgi:hypothetical protein